MQCNIESLNDIDKQIKVKIENTVETFVLNVFRWYPLLDNSGVYEFSKHENEVYVIPSEKEMHIRVVSKEELTDDGCVIKEAPSFTYDHKAIHIHTHVKSCSEGGLEACSSIVQDKCSRGRFDPTLCEQAKDKNWCGKKWKDLIDVVSSSDVQSTLTASFRYSEEDGHYTPSVDGVLSNLGLSFCWPTKEFIDALLKLKAEFIKKYGEEAADTRMQHLFEDVSQDVVEADLRESVNRTGTLEERLIRTFSARTRPSFPAEKVTEEEFREMQKEPNFYYVWYDGLWVSQQFHFCFVPMSTIMLQVQEKVTKVEYPFSRKQASQLKYLGKIADPNRLIEANVRNYRDLLFHGVAHLNNFVNGTVNYGAPFGEKSEDGVTHASSRGSLTKLHQYGIFTVNGQSNTCEDFVNPRTGQAGYGEQRSYVDGVLSVKLAKKLYKVLSKDPRVFVVVKYPFGEESNIGDQDLLDDLLVLTRSTLDVPLSESSSWKTDTSYRFKQTSYNELIQAQLFNPDQGRLLNINFIVMGKALIHVAMRQFCVGSAEDVLLEALKKIDAPKKISDEDLKAFFDYML